MAKKNIYTLSRNGKRMIITLIVLFLIAVAFLDRVLVKEIITPNIKTKTTSADKTNFHNKTFEVIYIVDGDTFDINHPDNVYKNTRVRLLGVDTPETKSPNSQIMYFGPEAEKYTSEILLNKKIKILTDPISPTRDKYGRLLCYVILSDGKMFNEMLINTGHAYADTRFQHSYYNKFRNLMKKARRSKTGLWQQVKPEDLPYYLKR